MVWFSLDSQELNQDIQLVLVLSICVLFNDNICVLFLCFVFVVSSPNSCLFINLIGSLINLILIAQPKR